MKTEAAVRTAQSVLKRYGFDESVPLELIKYRENYVFRLTSTSGERFAVRLHRPAYRTDSEISTELAYLHALAEQGLSVSQPVPTTAGDFLCVVASEDGPMIQLDVLRWVEGGLPLGDVTEAMSGDSPLRPESFRQLGVLTAELHERTSVVGRIPAFQRQAWDAEGLAGTSPQWGDPLALQNLSHDETTLLRAAVARLRHELAALSTSADTYGVIHADLTPENVLVGDNDQLVLIDFDDFGEGWHLFDLATTLFFFQPHPLYESYRVALLEGYSSVRPYPERFLDAWDTMLFARGLTYLGWAASRRGDEAAEYIVERVVPLVLGLARNYTSTDFPSKVL